jgi:hypothetical protein
MEKVFQDSQDYSPQAREIIKQYADEIITGAIVMRTPVNSLVKLGIKIVSLGNFDNDIYHLFLEVYFESGKSLLLEKNAVINFVKAPKVRTGSAMEKVGNWHEVSFQSLLDGARRVLGDKYFTYDAKNNNCQDFIMAILRGSNLGTPENYKFIKQDTRQMFKGLKKTRNIVKGVTRLGGIVDRLIHGVGIENKISRNTIMPRKMKAGEIEGSPVMQEGGSVASGLYAGRSVASGLYAGRGVKMEEKMAEDSVEGIGLYAGRGLHILHHHYHHSQMNESPEGRGFIKELGKKALKAAAKEAVHHGLPKVAGLAGAKLGMMIGGPLGAAAGAKLGHDLGEMGASEAKKAIGDGLKKPHMVKGSEAAKAYMAKIRAMRKK